MFEEIADTFFDSSDTLFAKNYVPSTATND